MRPPRHARVLPRLPQAGRFLILVLLALALETIQAEPAHDAPTDAPPVAKVVTDDQPAEKPWAPPPPQTNEADWVQLKSGEWLRGHVKSMYKDTLEFDSDELNLLDLDWEDVRQLRTRGRKSVRLSGPLTVNGIVHVTPDTIIVTSGKIEQVFDRDRLISIAAGDGREIEYWSAKVSLGLNFARGNTEQINYNTLADIRRRTSATRFLLNYLGNFSQAQGIDTVDNNRLNLVFDVFATRKYFWRPLSGEYYRDPFQNIQQRITVGAGIGYTLIDTPRTEWNVDTGVAYRATRFVTVEAGEDLDVSTPVLSAGTRYKTELTKRVDFKFDYAFNIVNQQSGRYTHHILTSLETELLSWLDFDISFVWDRTQEPTPLEDGSIPERDDYQLIFSLGVDY